MFINLVHRWCSKCTYEYLEVNIFYLLNIVILPVNVNVVGFWIIEIRIEDCDDGISLDQILSNRWMKIYHFFNVAQIVVYFNFRSNRIIGGFWYVIFLDVFSKQYVNFVFIG